MRREMRAQRLLTIELVPSSSWYRNVRSNVSKEEWDRIRKIVFNRAGYICEICGGRGPKWPVECHEVFEYDDERHIQKLARLVALCPACHEVKHIGLAGVRGRQDIAIAHLARVNNWSLKDARLYLEGCFETWSRRSRHQWTLDLSYLAQFGIATASPRPAASPIKLK